MTSGPQLTTVCYGALDPPAGGIFHFENLIVRPLPKTYPKMVLSHKGVSLSRRDCGATFLRLRALRAFFTQPPLRLGSRPRSSTVTIGI